MEISRFEYVMNKLSLSMHIRPRYVVDSVGVIVLLLLSSNSGNVVVELCLVILISPILLLFR